MATLKKQLKNKEKLSKEVEEMRASLSEKERETNAMQERLNTTKTLDELKERETELLRQNEEDQAIIQNEDTSPSDKEAGTDRVAERNEELRTLRTQIEERERGRPLLERIKEIFRKKWRDGDSNLSSCGGHNRL